MRQMRFMLDIETTGLDNKKDDILEIGIMAITREDGGLWTYYRHWEDLVPSPVKPNPEDKFAMEHMQALYKLSNDRFTELGDYIDPAFLRTTIRGWMMECLVSAGIVESFEKIKPVDIVMCGWNVSTFDLPFMVEKGYLSSKDYSYRVHEQSGGLHLAMSVLDMTREKLIDLAKFLQVLPGGEAVSLDGMSKHRAMYDCVDQAKTENALIRMLKVKVTATELEPT